MKLKVTIGLFLATFLLSAQTARMNRDIDVAEKILETIIGEISSGGMTNDDKFFIINSSPEVEGTYIEGFGAMFSITSGSLLSPLVMSETKKDKSGKPTSYTILRSRKKRYNFDAEDLEANKAEIQKTFKLIVETFFSEYAYLMRQIGDDEKIMIRYGSNSSRFDGAFPALVIDGKSKRNYSATITKTAIDAFQNNDNKQQLIDKIEYIFDEAKERAAKEKDLELLSTILKKLHNDKEEGVLRISGTPYYEKIEGIGAIYNLRIRSGNGSHYFGLQFDQAKTIWRNNGLAIIDGDSDDLTEIDSEALDKSYLSFLEGLKENIIDYGSIVKSINSGEALTFKLRFPDCRDCEKMPKKLEIIAKKSTLDGYRKEQISLEKAIQQLTIIK